MIVKDEAHILRRCIQAVRPIVDYALIVDTGSTDGTPSLAITVLEELHLPGHVESHPWQDFAHNRSRAIAQLRLNPDIDYALMIDADDLVDCEPEFSIEAFKCSLTADVYFLRTQLGHVTYQRPQIFTNKKPVYFKAVLHEYLALDEEYSHDSVPGLIVRSIQDGARSFQPDKYFTDARVLERALVVETDPFLRSRYTFYLAQSYRDCGETNASINTYLQRAEMGFWSEEVYCSLLYAARQMASRGDDLEKVIEVYARATSLVPERAEARYEAARLYRLDNKFELSAATAEPGLALVPSERSLFVEQWIYDYGLRDEFAVSAYWLNRWSDSLAACIDILSRDELPPPYRKRVAENASFSLTALSRAHLAGTAPDATKETE